MTHRRAAILIAKMAVGKLKKVILSPLVSASLRLANQQITGTDIICTVRDFSLDDICLLYPVRINRLFKNLNVHQAELSKVYEKVENRNLPMACEALVKYYQDRDTALGPKSTDKQLESTSVCDSDAVLQDIFTFQTLQDKVPRRNPQQLDWMHKGPSLDREWAWFLNRHYHFLDLLWAYQETEDTRYIRCLNDQVIDWILTNPSNHNPSIWAQWRGLEVTFRVVHWSKVFYSLQPVEEFTPVARILMLSSILDHAYYLRYLHSWGANWLVKEMCGLAAIALCWPEFKDAELWLNYACDRIINELPKQVYPDGVHKELTSHYHRAVLFDLQDLADLLTQSGRQIPQDLKKYLERMWNYLAYSMRPDGYGVLNNDSDRNNNGSLITQAAETYLRPDWHYIATNGETGQQPHGSPSVIFPWAGQMIMRNGWDADAQWAYFDIGPLGIYYHIHNDKLHLSIAAFGRDLLVDSGRYSYVRNKFWNYFRGSASHNIILVDGNGQLSDARESLRPLVGNVAIEPEFDFAYSTFDRGYTKLKGKATHTRAVLYLRGKYWVVVDQITTDRSRLIKPLWHFHPNCTVEVEGDSVASVDSNVGNLRIIPCSNLDWAVNLVQGQEDPVQGWWSGSYNQKVPNPTAIYSTQIDQSIAFAWVLLPARGPVTRPKVHLKSATEDTVLLSLETQEESQDMIAVRLSGNATIHLGNNLKLAGDCAILQPGQKPLVAYGTITDQTGQIIVEHGR